MQSNPDNDTIAEVPSPPTGKGAGPTMRGGPSPKHPTREAPLLGRWLADKYEILGIIGRGGLGTVYRGVQHPIGREVAVKVINPQRANDATLRQRFLREASAAAALKHPNLVALYDYGEDAGELFMVMELLEGHELREELEQTKRLDPQLAIDITRQICDGLGHAHERGLVHRDLKPENIMVSRDPAGELRVRVLDFGIVKVIREDALAGEAGGHETKAGVVIGTPAYMAPEQAYARGIDQTTDQYSMAVMLYEMLTGTLPYSKGSDFEVMTAHCIKPIPEMPAEAAVPAAVEAVVRKAMSKAGEDRYFSIQAFAAALDLALTDPAPAAQPPSRRRWLWAGAGLLAAGLAVALLWPDGAQTGQTTLGASPSSQARRDAKAAGNTDRSSPNTPSMIAQKTSAASKAPPPKTTPSVAPATAAPPSLAPPTVASTAPATQAVPAKPPRKPHRPKVRVTRIQKDCAAEYAGIKRSARNQSLSKGSGLCRKVAALGKRVRANRCAKPVPGIQRLLTMCEE